MNVSSKLDDHVLTIGIHRPERKNAVDGPTAALLADAFRAFEENEEAYVAVLYGQDTFCAGADLKAIAAGGAEANRLAPAGDGPMGPTRLELSKPVVAAIEGYAVAGGLELALWCDLRIAAEDAILGVFCRRFGVPLIDGGTVRLPRLIGESRAMDLILTGRPVSATEALHMGLVNRVVPRGTALAEAQALAATLSALPQACMRSDRASVRGSIGRDEREAMAWEFQRGLEIVHSGEMARGAQQFSGGAGRHGGTLSGASTGGE